MHEWRGAEKGEGTTTALGAMRRQTAGLGRSLLLLLGAVLTCGRLLEDDEAVCGAKRQHRLRRGARRKRTVSREDLGRVGTRRLVADVLDREVGLDKDVGAVIHKPDELGA